MMEGNYRDAIRDIETILKIHPEAVTSLTLSQLGLLYDHAPRYAKNGKEKALFNNEALRLYRKALKRDPDNFDAIWGIGRLWWHKKDPRALPYSIKAYETKKRLTGKIDWGLNVAVVYASLGRPKEAEKWLLKTIPKQGSRIAWYAELVRLWENNRYRPALRYRPSLVRSFSRQNSGFKASLIGVNISRLLQESKHALQ
jgi:tetratricopeptide (TPR) repeat protein